MVVYAVVIMVLMVMRPAGLFGESESRTAQTGCVLRARRPRSQERESPK
jgi:hypothetical protein